MASRSGTRLGPYEILPPLGCALLAKKIEADRVSVRLPIRCLLAVPYQTTFTPN